MWSLFLIPIMTMSVGFLLGVIVTDACGENKKIDKLERKIRMLERRLNG